MIIIGKTGMTLFQFIISFSLIDILLNFSQIISIIRGNEKKNEINNEDKFNFS